MKESDGTVVSSFDASTVATIEFTIKVIKPLEDGVKSCTDITVASTNGI